MMTKEIIPCPKCSSGRRKSSALCCTKRVYPHGVGYSCHHCGYSEFVLDESDNPEQIKDSYEFVPFPDDSLFKDYPDTVAYRYKNTKGDLYFYIVRTPDKKFFPMAYTKDHEVVMKRPPFKTLYRAEHLHSDSRPVLVVEGEKAAEAAAAIFTKADVVSWVGGAKGIKNGDWDLLKDRKVYLWPDNDEAGVAAMRGVAELIASPEIYLLDTSSLPPKYDLADNLTRDQLELVWNTASNIADPMLEGELDPNSIRALHSTKYKYYSFGWPTMDRVVKLPQSGLVVVSGRTNHGKSQFMINVALNLAKQGEVSALYLSYELPLQEMNLRMVKCLDSNNDHLQGWESDEFYDEAIRTGGLPCVLEYERLLQTKALRVVDSSADLEAILAYMTRMGEIKRRLVIFVDYVQIMKHTSDSRKSRYEQLKDMVESIRHVANKYSHLLITGSQLTAGESPLLDQVRESKDIENTAALHLKVWNKSKARDDKEKKLYADIPGDIIISVEKARQSGANGKLIGFKSPNGVRYVPVTFESKEY